MSNIENQNFPGMSADKLDPEEMNKMIVHYRTHIAPVLTELKNSKFPDVDQNTQDATSAWISIADLEKFIADNKATGNANGIRIFYGVHVSDSFVGDPGKNLKGLHTIIFVPTTSGDQPPTYMNSRNIVPVADTGGIGDKSTTESATTGTGYALDHVAICPPLCSI